MEFYAAWSDVKVALAFPGCHRRGGVERVLVECANHLAARGHDTHVIAADIAENVLDKAVVQHKISIPLFPAMLRLAMFPKASERVIRALSPLADVAGGFGVAGPSGAVVWVQSVHAAWLEISGGHRGFWGRSRQRFNPIHPFILSLERQYFGERKYKRLIALTPEVRDDLMRFYKVPEKDIDLMPNGFAPGEFNVGRRTVERAEVRRELGYSEDDRVIIFVANELERKGFGPLLRAIAMLEKKHVHLLAVGRLNASAYASEIEQLGMTNRVRFTGPTSNVARFYAAGDIFALPTEYEAWGLVIVEAMACGLPVLTSRLAGAAVAVREGHSGELLDDPRNIDEIRAKLLLLLNGNHPAPTTISDSVASYRWDRLLPKYESILEMCANAREQSSSYVPDALTMAGRA